MTAERARADAFFHADYLAAIETVGSGGKEGMACCKTVAATGRGVSGEGRVCLNFEGSDCRVLDLVSGALRMGRGTVRGLVGWWMRRAWSCRL